MGTKICHLNPPVTLKMRSRSPKAKAQKLVPMIHPGKFGGIPSTGSRDIVGTRTCHADADTDADTNGIRTETNMPPHLWWGTSFFLYPAKQVQIRQSYDPDTNMFHYNLCTKLLCCSKPLTVELMT